MNCYIPSGHLLRPAKATGVDKLRPMHKELGLATERRDRDGDNNGPPAFSRAFSPSERRR